jgi:hypothetical protein
MDLAQGISSLLGLGVASGLNVYAAVLTVGLAQRFGWLTGLPQGMDILAHPAVLIGAGLMYLAEFVADKIPGFTPVWDGLHTFIRPVGGALLAFGAAGNLDPRLQVLALIAGGSLALGTHATKMGTRLAAHAVPDPISHSAISLAEDFGAVGLIFLAYQYPWVALPVIGAVIVGIAVMLPYLFRVLFFLLRTAWGVLMSWTEPDPDSEIPAWAAAPGHRVIKGYIRSGKGLARLRPAYVRLDRDSAVLSSKGWFSTKTETMKLPGRLVSGVVLDFLELETADGRKASLYLTKDWSRYYSGAVAAPQAAAVGV